MSRAIYTIDAETDPFDGSTSIRPFLWDIFDGQSHHTVESVKDAHAFIERFPGIYYAHNGGKFDYLLSGFCDPIESGERLTLISGRLVRFRMLGSEFRDSFAILPSALRDIGGKGEIDYEKMRRANRAKHMHEITKYLHGDTEALWRAVVAFRSEYGAGITLAGCALKQLQEICLDGDKVPALSAKADRDSRAYYKGGRVEAFASGHIRSPFNVFDITSAYPRAMIESHAWGKDCDCDAPKISAPINPQAFYCVDATSHAALPVRDKGKTQFPDARGKYCATGWEILAGLETGTVKLHSIIERRTFAKVQSFKKYVGRFYALKSEAPKGSHARLFAKLLLNSAYGKLGANPENYREARTCEPSQVAIELEADEGWEMNGTLGKCAIIERPLRDDEMHRQHVGAAASVTGWVRAYLWRAICDVRKRGGSVLYCDTDSLVVRGCQVDCGEKLGDWSLDAECSEGYIAGKKMYAFHCSDGTWKLSSKGARLDWRQIRDVALGKAVEWRSNAPTFSVRGAPKIIARKIRRTT